MLFSGYLIFWKVIWFGVESLLFSKSALDLFPRKTSNYGVGGNYKKYGGIMGGIFFSRGSVFLIVPLLMFLSCGSLETPVFDSASITYDSELHAIEFEVLLDDTLEFPVALSLPIKDYGELHIVPGTYDEQAKIIMVAYLDAIGVVGDMVYTLPNGTRFPRFIDGPLLEVRIKENYYAYISPETYEYVGFAILIPAINEKFPAGFVISSTFKNDEGEVIGAGVFFGPKKNGEYVEVPGGIFAVADITSVLDEIKNRQAGVAVISASESDDFTIGSKQLKTLDKAGYLK